MKIKFKKGIKDDNSTSPVTEILTDSVTVSEENSTNGVDESNLASSEKQSQLKTKLMIFELPLVVLSTIKKSFLIFITV